MPPGVATLVFTAVIFCLFWLDRDSEPRVSPALWIPIAWLAQAGSRLASEWMMGSDAVEVGSMALSSDRYMEGSPIDRFILSSLLMAGVLVLLARRERAGAFLRANGAILLFFLYCGASILWSDYPDVAFKRWTKALGDLVMVLVVVTDDNPSAAVKRLLTRTGFLLIPLSVLLVKYYPDLGRGYNRWTWTTYYTGVATGKNGLGYICMLFGLASLWCILETFREDESEGRVRSLIVHGIVLAMALWLFRLADSVTSFACFLIGTVLIVATSPGRIRRRAASVHLVLVMLVLFLIFGYFISGGTGLVEAMGRDPTLTGRTALWDDILRMRVDPLFGAGFESFWLGERIDKLWAVYWWHPSQAHNGYLEVFLNLGWTGVCLLAGVIVTGYRNVVRRFAGDPGTARLALAYFVIALLYNLTEAAFKLIHPMWVVFLLVVSALPTLAEDR